LNYLRTILNRLPGVKDVRLEKILPSALKVEALPRIPKLYIHRGSYQLVDEEGEIPESDDAFSQVSIGAYKLATLIKVSEELLNDSVFNLEAYIAKEFGRRIGAKEEEAFFTGDGSGNLQVFSMQQMEHSLE